MEKTKEIIELENLYNIKLVPINREYNILDQVHNKNAFELNDNEEIIGLNFYSTGISDFKILQKFSKLCSLSIGLEKNNNFLFLKDLSSLTALSLKHNQISDIKFIKDLKKIEILNLDNNEISDLTPIKNLINLKRLELFENQISDISSLSNLLNLEKLNLWDNTITDITPIKKLTNLTILDLDDNQIEDITALENLKKIETLYLSNNKITDISPINNLDLIRTLNISDNKISNISNIKNLKRLRSLEMNSIESTIYPSIFSNLDFLTSLSCIECNITNLDFLKDLKSLISLNLSDNKISDLSPLTELNRLSSLNISKNLISDISQLKNLKSLTSLNLNHNKISDIEVLEKLENLTYLNLSKNLITNIRPLLNFLSKNITINPLNYLPNALYLEDNPLEFPPIQTLKGGNDAIIRFFKKIDEEGTATIFEAKLTLVGEGSAGKTSLLKRLLNSTNKLPEEKNRTRGILIADWEFKKQKNKKHIAHIWDFGGQDVYYPVHRFFLTENSVFVLLASSRQNTHHFDYWIPTIYQFGGKSPIILGQTCHDGNIVHWNDIGAYIANENFNIIKDQEKNYYEINLPNKNKGLSEIKNSIINQIVNLPHYKKSVPKSWITIRELINSIKEENCISYLDLKNKIKESNPQSFSKKEDIDDCLIFFHSIGVLLWYHKEIKLKNWVILNPKWSVDAVYKIIDDDKISNQKGIIFSVDFERVWEENIYEDKHEILKDMLEVFKIAFPKKHNQLDYIMPTRLQSMSSESIWADSESCLQIEYQYEFMPKGLVNQISAELSRYIIDDNQVWNNGVNFSDDETVCQVFEDFYHRKITVKAKGKDARGIIMIIMNALKDITDGYKGVIPKIIIPCFCAKCLSKKDPTTFSYEMLLDKIKEKPDSKVFCNISEQVFKVEELLFNVGLPNPIKEVREEIEKMEKMEKIMEEKNTPLKVFVTYSWSDENNNFDQEHQNKVGNFVSQLRSKWGLDASFDLQKEENNFVKMMFENLTENDKIIIVLNKGYASKANKFKNGVGTEYARIINDITQNPKKYILISFEKRNSDIYPFGFQGSDVIEISSDLVSDNLPESQNRLLSKLIDEPLIEMPEIAGKTPKVTKKSF
ncbi:Leucine-rich repeat (LRR) protein/GTPase SAR1 family protein [Flavobacterium sp. HSC-32F16]|uniref:leucine-rich repeat domain-containing protein n=1 Tax=Flavobacterium sp. HSC-32F16 TaxID=2910964 RepID=UPI0020A5DA85|nr:leucine-rich repeat domain-containing protein [Flavobacterium sp. HSC-32F16]MCP2025924.1 Leucine-rich repeat (LRR) protein/GTPase SAR1 family protein [Flavobacterium sp. HSC-32F16]